MNPAWKHAAGLVAALGMAVASHALTAPGEAARLSDRATEALDRAGGREVQADFTTVLGLYTRHPRLATGRTFTPQQRFALANAVAAVPGVGGVRWVRAPGLAEAAAVATLSPDHCQNDVEGLLRVRTIRFDEGKATIDAASLSLVDEVADALRPCVGSRIAVEGHTDPVGDEATNQALSLRRAESVRDELMRRGLPGDSLVAKGFGASRPIEGLNPDDPANRRIEFKVIAVAPLRPTPVDTPVAQ